MEKASEDLDSKLNDMLSRVNQINNYNINFSPSHSTASSEYGSEEEKIENDTSISNQNEAFSQFMDSEKHSDKLLNNNCETNINQIKSNQNDFNPINSNIRSEFKFKSMFDNQSQKNQNQSIKRKLSEVKKDINQEIDSNKKIELTEKNENQINNSKKENINKKTLKPDFTKIFSKPLYKTEDI